MKYSEIQEMLKLIGEFHWHKNRNGKEELYVFIEYYNVADFMRLFSAKHPSLFDEEGVLMHWKGTYLCIPNFDDVLDFCGIEENEMKEIFNEEKQYV